MVGAMLDNVREQAPLVHCITNSVSANDCANIVLACGASPIMAEAPQEAAEITARCRGLSLNLGMPSEAKIQAMLLSGKEADRRSLPVVLDPVGVGASDFRMQAALALIGSLRPAVLRGNLSEIRALALQRSAAGGVDTAHRVTEENLAAMIELAKHYAASLDTIVAVTGQIDIVTDGQSAYCIRNGTPEMSRVTGTGCQLTALTGAFLAANPDTPLLAAAAAVCAMGLAGEIAWRHMQPGDGNRTYGNRIIDAIFNMDGDTLRKGAKYEVR